MKHARARDSSYAKTWPVIFEQNTQNKSQRLTDTIAQLTLASIRKGVGNISRGWITSGGTKGTSIPLAN
jgi:hypothetical protein